MLSRGLIFSRTPRDIDKGLLKTDIDMFKRRRRLKRYFKDDVSNTYGSIRNCYEFDPTFNIKLGCNPPRSETILESYLSLLEKEALSISPEGKNYNYLSSGERHVFLELKCDRSIVTKKADKGSAVVVWDRDVYCVEAHRQLGDSSVYKDIPELEGEVSNKVSEIQVCDRGLSDKEA